MKTTDALIRIVVDRLVRLLLQEREPKTDAPEPALEPEPRKLRQSERPGISMNELARSVPKRCPPRKPSWER